MKKLMMLAVPALLFGADSTPLERLFDSKLNTTQRANACYELRGVKDTDTLSAMARAMEDAGLLSCAVENLRIAGDKEALKQALGSSNEQVRAAAARSLGTFQSTDLLEPLSRAAQDENLLVATNALAGLCAYSDPAVIPYLAALAAKGGMVGDMAIDRLNVLDAPGALKVARNLLDSQQVPDKLYAMRIIGANGDKTDIPSLKKIAAAGQENLAQRNRGFGFMPPISLSRAAETAIQSIESR